MSDVWYVLLAAVLWGTTGTAQALAPAGTLPLAVGAARLAIGGGALLLWAWGRGRLADGRAWHRRPLLLGAWAVAAYQSFFFAGVGRTGVAVGTMVAIGSAPVIAGLWQWGVGGVRPSIRWVAATICAVAGCSLLALAGGKATVNMGGILLALGAGGSYALFAVMTKELLADHAPETVTAVVFSLGAVFLLPLLFFVDISWLARPSGLLVAVWLGLGATALAYLLYTQGLAQTPVTTAVTLSLAEPLTATLLGIFLLGESVTVPILAGMALVFGGLALLAGGGNQVTE
ncbi:MAG: EamA family transporter [Chloroflexi bacterium]|nr:EamA family transporter [Ardenticatenaceae bacterium]MBL1131126.1 EamA family transporter [Chloroflexota bacterium]NOG37225.1 EamA family transporter [Chloroflexota bacterium]GIK56464.1 MAG: transporter [Chloroflexota bacterium]